MSMLASLLGKLREKQPAEYDYGKRCTTTDEVDHFKLKLDDVEREPDHRKRHDRGEGADRNHAPQNLWRFILINPLQ